MLHFPTSKAGKVLLTFITCLEKINPDTEKNLLFNFQRQSTTSVLRQINSTVWGLKKIFFKKIVKYCKDQISLEEMKIVMLLWSTSEPHENLFLL